MGLLHAAKSEEANISIDFLAASAILLVAFIFAIITVHNMMTPYSGYTKELYPTADRAITLLLEDEGKWHSSYKGGADWELPWIKDSYSHVGRIGFLENKENNTLDCGKVDALMTRCGDKNNIWWEYPANNMQTPELENASRALGLGRYNFYLQIRSLNMTSVETADQNAIKMAGDKGDVVSVVRYSILNEFTYGEFDGANLMGHFHPRKLLFGITPGNLILVGDALNFSVTNWTIDNGSGNIPRIKHIMISDRINTNFELLTPTKLCGNEFNISKNDVPFNITPGTSVEINMNISGPDDNVTFSIPINTFNEYVPDWDNVESVYIQIEVTATVNLQEEGITLFSDTFRTRSFPVETILWVW